MTKKKSPIIYSINVDDIQEVAGHILDRELTLEERRLVESRVGDYISWFDAIELAIEDQIVRQENKR
ncbi:MAG: hypothetical protein HS124_09950 [Anaerolineales bacterium]|nr:hypothetical protein [Anaerolineales bacterium]MCL4260154.1 hypothetical protein [Anaerolineales bacterium]